MVDKFLLQELNNLPEADRQELVAILNPWRPIETAPRSKDVLVYGAGRISTGTWLSELHGSYWSWDGIPEQPTHWLPLPAPPSEDKP